MMSDHVFLYILLAYAIDLAVGDPRFIPHPVVIIGKTIERLEAVVRRVARKPTALKVAGGIVAFLVLGGSWFITYILIHWLFSVNFWLGSALSIWLISTTISTRGLAEAAGQVYKALKEEDLVKARKKVGWIVGRDTCKMDSGDISRATVETVAENTVDGIVSPIFYTCIGGAPLAMAYRAVNTLDSMLGYKNHRYIDFGMVSARLDDLANYLPARLTGILLVGSAAILGMNPKRAWQSVRRDASSHPSPNSGIPESAVAGALGVRLGGINYYNGRQSFRAYMGDDLVALQPEHIHQTVKLMYLSSVMMASLGSTILYFVATTF